MTPDPVATTADISARWSEVMVPNYQAPRIELVSGSGAFVTDAAGKRYLDLLGGLAVNILGHAHPAVVAAVRDQVGRLGHTSNLYANPQSVRLATRLAALRGGDKVYLCSTGTEANEAAYKMVRRRAHAEQRAEARVIAFHSAFHGRTMGSLALTGQPAYREGFGPYPEHITHLPFNDVAALEKTFTDHDVVAVFGEIVQGEGGVIPMSHEFAETLRRHTAASDVALVVDEVQTGVGRTGRFFASEHFGLEPDIVTLAKGLGGGLPIGATLARPAWGDALTSGSHGTTFGGNAVSAAAANAVLDVYARERLEARADRLGAVATQILGQELADNGLAPRGLGLLQGVPLGKPVAPAVVDAMAAKGFLVGQAGKGVSRIAPPLIVPEAEFTTGLGVLAREIHAALAAA